MRKAILCCVCVWMCLMCLLCSCCTKYDYSVDGYENFQTKESHYELNQYILPSADFVEKFQCKDILYSYRENYKSMAKFTEKSLIVIDYQPEVYEQAKEYCFKYIQLSQSNPIAYNGYSFMENIKLAVGQERYGKSNEFPRWFNMFAYNDETCTLVFMGFYSPDYTSSDAQAVRDDWEGFLQKYFFDLYSFGN